MNGTAGFPEAEWTERVIMTTCGKALTQAEESHD